jgi:hypothetical protein
MIPRRPGAESAASTSRATAMASSVSVGERIPATLVKHHKDADRQAGKQRQRPARSNRAAEATRGRRRWWWRVSGVARLAGHRVKRGRADCRGRCWCSCSLQNPIDGQEWVAAAAGKRRCGWQRRCRAPRCAPMRNSPSWARYAGCADKGEPNHHQQEQGCDLPHRSKLI